MSERTGHPAGEAARSPETLPVLADRPITLGQFLKMTGLASTGGEAKHMVLSGLASVNGSVEKRRGRKLEQGDVVEVGEIRVEVGQRPGPPGQGV